MTNGNGKLPMGWRWVRLGEVCSFRHGGTPSKLEKAYWLGDIPWVSPKDMHQSTIESTEDTISELAIHEKRLALASTNSLLVVVRSGVLARTVPLAIPERPVAFNQDIKAITPNENHLYVQYLYWVLRSSESYILQFGIKKGATVHSVISGFLEALRIPLPPIVEQQRIATVLNERMQAVKRAQTATLAQLKAARALPAAYLRGVFEGNEAKKWPQQPLGQICKITARQVNPTLPEYGNLPHVNGENIESGTGRLIRVRTAAEDGMTSGKYLFESGDVLYSKLRPYLRKATVVDFRGVCSADMYPIRVDARVLTPGFLLWLLLSSDFTKYADEQSRRARMPKLNREQLFAWRAPLPPIGEQVSIAQRLVDRFADANECARQIEFQLAAIEQLPRALLRKAFSGEL